MKKKKEKKSEKKCFYKWDIPDDYETDDEKLDYLVKDIKKMCSSLIGKEGKATEYKIKIGRRLIALQKILKKEKVTFHSYIKKELPYVTRSAQRWMRMAKEVDIDECPNLTCLGDTRLLALSTITKGKEPIHEYLEDNDISTDFDADEVKEVHKFREEVQALINENYDKSDRSVKKTLSDLQKSLHTYVTKIQSIQQSDLDDNDTQTIQKTIEDAEALIENLRRFLEDEEDEE
jgi:hypothetical protein